MDDSGLLDPKLDLAALGRLDGRAHVVGDRAQFRVRHHAARAQDLAQPADHRHHVRGRDAAIEIQLARFNLFGEVLRPDQVGAGGLGFLGLIALGEDGDPHGLAGAVRQTDHAAHVLVGVARIDAQVHGDLDGFVELDGAALLDQLDRLLDRVGGGIVEAVVSLAQPLARACHRPYPTTLRPMERAEPAMILAAASMSLAFRSTILASAISRTWSMVTVPAVSLLGSWLPFWMPAAFFR